MITFDSFLSFSTNSSIDSTIIPASLDGGSSTELLSVELPPSRDAGIIVESIDELVEKLKNEAKVIT